MKQVLIIDESPMFREYLRLKLEDSGIEVSIGINVTDGISKMRAVAPDLIIIDYHLSRQGVMEALRQKKSDLNVSNAPVIILAQHIDQDRLIELAPYGVKKVFTKPVKVDTLFSTISGLLGVSFTIDESPGIVEAHVNDNIIFIEIAQGLNRDKLDLLGFKITELIDLYDIKVPRVIVMLSDITLSFADTPNMEKLFDTVVQSSKTKLRHIRILTTDDFVRKFIKGRKAYDGIEVVSNLQYALDGLLSGVDSYAGKTEETAEIISARILQADNSEDPEAMALKFGAEAKSANPAGPKAGG
ncbi:MAG: response regulator [Treponema sp.]|nr:response regulator [Treponema sp.]